MTLEEGWYLMSTADLERELARHREREASVPPSNAVRLTVDEALVYRDAGNVPDEHGRTLRLVLAIAGPAELSVLHAKRLAWEPDFHEAPQWRREASRPVNIVPLHREEVSPSDPQPWWDDPELAALESVWRSTGKVEGLNIPAEYRGFVYKTILALKSAGKDVTVDSVVDSISRWVPPPDADRLRAALRSANEG